MVFYKSSYHPNLRHWLKGMPSIMLTCYFLLLFPLGAGIKEYLLFERNRKKKFYSNYYEQLIRERGEFYRYGEYPQIYGQP